MQETITGEVRLVIDLANRFEDMKYSTGVGLMRESLRYCRQYLNDARLAIDDTLTFSRDFFED